MNGAPSCWEASLLAACWAGGFRAVASRRSAAALHGLPAGRRDLVEITCPRWRRARHDGLIVHETKALDPVDLTVVSGIAVTTPARTLFDLGGVCRRGARRARARERTAARARQRGGAGRDRQAAQSLRPAGWSDSQAAACWRGHRSNGRPRARWRRLLLQALRAHGLPAPVPQHEVWQGSALSGSSRRCVPGRTDRDRVRLGRVPHRPRAASSTIALDVMSSSRRAGSRSTSGRPISATAAPSPAPRSLKPFATASPDFGVAYVRISHLRDAKTGSGGGGGGGLASA